MSLWLATHLTDLLEKLNLVDDDDDETYELPLRDYFVFQYTDMLLLGHEGYWEVACDYLSGCGAQGVGRIREILKRISLNIGNSPNFTQADDNEDTVMEVTSIIVPPGGTAESNDDLETVNALLKVASDHGLEDERREICRVSLAYESSDQVLQIDSAGKWYSWLPFSYCGNRDTARRWSTAYTRWTRVC